MVHVVDLSLRAAPSSLINHYPVCNWHRSANFRLHSHAMLLTEIFANIIKIKKFNQQFMIFFNRWDPNCFCQMLPRCFPPKAFPLPLRIKGRRIGQHDRLRFSVRYARSSICAPLPKPGPYQFGLSLAVSVTIPAQERLHYMFTTGAEHVHRKKPVFKMLQRLRFPRPTQLSWPA